MKLLRTLPSTSQTTARPLPRLVVLTALLGIVGLPTRLLADDLKSQVDALVQPHVNDKGLVGCVVGIVKDGKSHVFAYGETKKGDGKRPSGATIYEIGSISKAFTGTLLADAVNAGLLKLDDPVQMHVPKSIQVPVKGDTPITLEHLATHTSGLPRLPNNMFPKDFRNPYADYSVKDLYAYLGGYQGSKKPGDYEYSNYGMGLLGHVLAKKQNTTYEQLVLDRIAKPLGMSDTRITLSDDQKEHLAPPYNASLEPDRNWDFPTLAGAGGLRSTVDDMLKLVTAGLAADDQPTTRALQTAFEKRHTMKNGLAIGLAWHITPHRDMRWHNGMTGGYASWVSIIPKCKAGVVVLSNTASDRVDGLGEQLTRLACGIPVTPPEKRVAIKLDPKTLEPYAGNYALSPNFTLTVTVENGSLMVQATGQAKHPVFAESKHDFFYRVVDAQITFVPDENGSVNELVLHQNGLNIKGTREK